MTPASHGSPPLDSSQWLRALFAEFPVAIGFSRDGVTLDVNPAYVKLFGFETAAELRGQPILNQIAPSHREQVLAMVNARARGEAGLPRRYETRGRRRDGSEFPFEVTTTRVVLADGPLAIAFLADVSEREEAVTALRASEERFRTLSAAAFEGVFLHAGGKIILANDAGAAMYGFEPSSIVGVDLMALTAPESRARVADSISRGTSEPYEGTAMRRDGSTFFAEVRGKTMSHQGRPARVTVIRDVTERKQAEAEQRALAERVRQAQKLESLGVLAGGVAHDFNNILTVIANGVALAKRETGLGAASAAHLDAIALAVDRAADLCRQMLAYAGKTQLARESFELSGLVGEMSTMLEASIGRRTTLLQELAPALPTLVGDATQIRQVVMNLVLNAAEAIVSGEGVVRVSTGSSTYAAGALKPSAADGELPAGVYVWLQVQDDGIGMDAATVAQMFDPFFTTKFVGRGLGMAAVLGIVRGHEGGIDVESNPGRGTRIRVYLPARAGISSTSSRDGRQPPEPIRTRGTVMLVDDEKNVRISTELLLRGFGFDVLAARDGAEAVALFQTDSHRIDVVMLDFTMPRMDGLTTLRELRRIAPGVPVVLTSGYGAGPLGEEARHGAVPDAVLAKPYAAEHLRETLERLLGRSAARPVSPR